jgi:hypothetical protein
MQRRQNVGLLLFYVQAKAKLFLRKLVMRLRELEFGHMRRRGRFVFFANERRCIVPVQDFVQGAQPGFCFAEVIQCIIQGIDDCGWLGISHFWFSATEERKTQTEGAHRTM